MNGILNAKPAVVNRPPRSQLILEALAHELETRPGQRITTAGLARAVGVSEAALYRHFPSKAKMFEGLIIFIEDSVFSLISRILEEPAAPALQCEKILGLVLAFAEKNPGMTRIMLGDALIGENERLRQRIGQFYDRIDTQLKQIIREGKLSGALPGDIKVQVVVNMFMAVVEGRMNQFVRSGFTRSPLEKWDEQWQMLADCTLISAAHSGGA